MPAESAADRLGFLDADEFGVAASYVKDSGPAIEVAGIFDAEHQMLGIGDGDIASVGPEFTCREADLPAGYGDGDEITVNGVSYFVRHSEPDGTGMVKLRLERDQ
ncbi:head-tail joining protein [Hoeflea sp.]|uniref:head-tail joining protein n=1 Tax=Hoeflea sp. TaxID=1940281 RepID=UPI003B5191FB